MTKTYTKEDQSIEHLIDFFTTYLKQSYDKSHNSSYNYGPPKDVKNATITEAWSLWEESGISKKVYSYLCENKADKYPKIKEGIHFGGLFRAYEDIPELKRKPDDNLWVSLTWYVEVPDIQEALDALHLTKGEDGDYLQHYANVIECAHWIKIRDDLVKKVRNAEDIPVWPQNESTDNDKRITRSWHNEKEEVDHYL